VGFPSESDADFEATLGFLREIEFDDSFSFKFSPRSRTAAADWSSDFVPEPVADERLARLLTLQAEIRERASRGRVGEVVEVLVEGRAKKGEGFLTGKTSQNRSVNFPGPEAWVGTLRRVEIREALSNSFRGVVCRS
jgi:tRNA-2-methylthio-N6-dimethylallyladenosine synthase